MRVITLEEHVSTSAIQRATGRTPQSATDDYWRKVLARLLDIGATRLSEMDAAGIDVQVLSLAPFDSGISDAAALTSLVHDANDAISEAVRTHPGRFFGFANLALQNPGKAVLEFERCINKLGFKGALVSGTIDGRFLDDVTFSPLFEAAQSLDVPIYLHPAPPPESVREAYFSGLPGQSGLVLSTAGWGWHAETALHVLRLILSGVFERFPKLKMIIGHMGENLPFALGRVDSVFERQASHLKRSVGAYLQDHFWITVSGYFTMAPFLCALSVVGADRILFSVDYPFSETRVARAFLDAIPVSPEDRVKIAGRNAQQLLKI